jgi:hypothetical protein
MEFWLLDDSLRVSIRYACEDSDLKDNICISIHESCPDEEKLFIADETNIFIPAAEAQQLANALMRAVTESKARDE